jgi:hypothetical protein
MQSPSFWGVNTKLVGKDLVLTYTMYRHSGKSAYNVQQKDMTTPAELAGIARGLTTFVTSRHACNYCTSSKSGPSAFCTQCGEATLHPLIGE